MKLINLAEQPLDITHVLELAQEGPVVLLAADGREYVLAEADDFDREVEQLRNSVAFQRFLDERSAYQTTTLVLPNFQPLTTEFIEHQADVPDERVADCGRVGGT